MARNRHEVSVADAKRYLSELLGRVDFGRETITITKRGRAVAKLIPIERPPRSFSDIVGFLDDDDAFFAALAELRDRWGSPTGRDPFRHTKRRRRS